MEVLDNLAALNIIVGFVSPTVISVINRPTMSAQNKAFITFGFCVVVGFLTALFMGQLTVEDITSSILLTFVAAITAYNGLFKPTGIAAKIEEKTTPGPVEIDRGETKG